MNDPIPGTGLGLAVKALGHGVFSVEASRGARSCEHKVNMRDSTSITLSRLTKLVTDVNHNGRPPAA